MAEYLSDLLTDIVTNGKYPSANFTGRGGCFAVEAKATVLAAHANGDIYRMFQVPSNAVPIAQFINNSAITDGTDYDVGLYNNGSGGTVLDRDVLVDGLSMATASNSVVRAGTHLIADTGKTFWQLAGLSTDPGGELTVAITANTVGTADGTIYYALLFNMNN